MFHDVPSILCGIFRVRMYVRVCGRRSLGLCSVVTIEASVYVGMYLCSVLKPNSSAHCMVGTFYV